MHKTNLLQKEKKQHIVYLQELPVITGKISWQYMANEKFDENKFTAASNKLSLGTWVRVSNLRNNKSVIVQITDRMHPK